MRTQAYLLFFQSKIEIMLEIFQIKSIEISVPSRFNPQKR